MTGLTTPLGQDEYDRLEQFLRRRQLKEPMIALLDAAKKNHNLKLGQVTTSKAAPYEDIVQSVATAIKSNWLSTDAVSGVLEEAEIAGRQHVCAFVVDAADVADVKQSLLAPVTLNTDPGALSEFWNIPMEPYCRILRNDVGAVVIKVIAPRRYWVEVEHTRTDEIIEIKRKREKERSALIIKLDLTQSLIQFRVPIREHAPGVDTSQSVYAFIAELVESQYGEKGLKWLAKLKPWKIGDAFPKIITNRDDFQLHTDTPENKYIKSSMSKKGAPDSVVDIRDFEEWVYESGYARSSIRGIWRVTDDASVDVRMHYEQVKVNAQMSRHIARLYFAKPYSDQDVEHVIKRIREHF